MAFSIQLFPIKAFYLLSSFGYCLAIFFASNGGSLLLFIIKLIAKRNTKQQYKGLILCFCQL